MRFAFILMILSGSIVLAQTVSLSTDSARIIIQQAAPAPLQYTKKQVQALFAQAQARQASAQAQLAQANKTIVVLNAWLAQFPLGTQ